MIFGNWLWPLRRRQFFSAASASLKIMASAVLFERHPLERTVRWRTVANELSMTLVVRRCFQISCCWLFGSLFRTLAVLCTQQRWPRVVLPENSIQADSRDHGGLLHHHA